MEIIFLYSIVLGIILIAGLSIAGISMKKKNDNRCLNSTYFNMQKRYSREIIKTIITRNTFPLIGEQFEHLEKYQSESDRKINFNLEGYIK